jgi:hypothetical protein
VLNLTGTALYRVRQKKISIIKLFFTARAASDGFERFQQMLGDLEILFATGFFNTVNTASCRPCLFLSMMRSCYIAVLVPIYSVWLASLAP